MTIKWLKADLVKNGKKHKCAIKTSIQKFNATTQNVRAWMFSDRELTT